ncbi:four helix bundle protein [bacterium]|nr:four helix bundle protein [bacterium]
MYCLTSQVRRALLSVPSNIVEGCHRNRTALFLNYLEIAYASLAEAKYQIYFLPIKENISLKMSIWISMLTQKKLVEYYGKALIPFLIKLITINNYRNNKH